MNQRGLTLLELVAALALTGLLTLILTQVLHLAIHARQRLQPPLRWHSGADAVMALIAEDLLAEPPRGDETSIDPLEVHIDTDGLRIITRCASPGDAGFFGTVEHRYRLQASTRQLQRQCIAIGRRPEAGSSMRVLLGNIASWQAVLREQLDKESERALAITITAVSGNTEHRTFAVEGLDP